MGLFRLMGCPMLSHVKKCNASRSCEWGPRNGCLSTELVKILKLHIANEKYSYNLVQVLEFGNIRCQDHEPISRHHHFTLILPKRGFSGDGRYIVHIYILSKKKKILPSIYVY